MLQSPRGWLDSPGGESALGRTSFRLCTQRSPAYHHPRSTFPACSMNYLRGAVSAISAPYQYYKDLNPATLTGAIDVIVVKRPRQHDGQTSNTRPGEDEHELVCSPFHVRFGKWQVLRPGDKKVRRRARLTLPSEPDLYV